MDKFSFFHPTNGLKLDETLKNINFRNMLGAPEEKGWLPGFAPSAKGNVPFVVKIK